LIIVMWARPRPNGHKTTVPRSDRIWSFFFFGTSGVWSRWLSAPSRFAAVVVVVI
jgi:hypothetical protein